MDVIYCWKCGARLERSLPDETGGTLCLSCLHTDKSRRPQGRRGAFGHLTEHEERVLSDTCEALLLLSAAADMPEGWTVRRVYDRGTLPPTDDTSKFPEGGQETYTATIAYGSSVRLHVQRVITWRYERQDPDERRYIGAYPDEGMCPDWYYVLNGARVRNISGNGPLAQMLNRLLPLHREHYEQTT